MRGPLLSNLPKVLQTSTRRNRGEPLPSQKLLTLVLLLYSQELEDALLLDCSPQPSNLLVELFSVFLNGIVGKDIK